MNDLEYNRWMGQEFKRLKYELEYYEALIDYLCDMVPCLGVVIEDFEFNKGDEE